ncbi:MAG TPA: HNH endonuclease signature motif containing protein [Thermoleophilaceae bacterium]|nr:HNH endonuclease signature motif containing protein [Thermoleophilaceae bacterium]
MKTRDRVSALLAEGLSISEVAEALALAKSTVCYHARRLGRAPDPRFAIRHDWSAIREHYDGGASVTECRERFGFGPSAWHDAVRRGAVVPRARGRSLESYLADRSRNGRSGLKRRLLAEGDVVYACEWCETSEWRGRRLSLALHHVNGDGTDNRRENLLLLCPNCNSQTENYGGRNSGGPRETSGGIRSSESAGSTGGALTVTG